MYYNTKWKKYRSDKKIDLNYAEKQGKKEVSNKDENTYFFIEDKKFMGKKYYSKPEIPKKYLEKYKKFSSGNTLLSISNNNVIGSIGNNNNINNTNNSNNNNNNGNR